MRAAAAVLGAVLASPAMAADYVWDLPEGFPPPAVPADNPMNAAKVELGRRLFLDTRLSVTGAYSCASCHDPARHFTDGKALAEGALGDALPFNTPTLLNVAYNASFGWLQGGPESLEAQHRVPLLATDPIELGYSEDRAAALNDDAALRGLTRRAFGAPSLDTTRIVRALASYVRTLIRSSPVDAYLYRDDRDALSPSARRGLAVFTADVPGCVRCHSGFNFSGPVRTAGFEQPPRFHRNRVGGDERAFRAPSLRFVSRTAPYMHDGSLPDLTAVIAFYETADTGELEPFSLSDDERSDLIEFLRHL